MFQRTTSPLRSSGSKLALLMLLTFASTAEARTPSCVRDPECAALMSRALTLSKSLQFKDALRLYQQAYARVSDPGLLSNLGRIHQRLGQQDEAITQYRRYLSLPLPTQDPETRSKTAEWLAEVLQVSMNTPSLAIRSESEKSKSSKPGRATWRWITIGAATLTVTALAVGLGVGLTRTSCNATVCFNF